MKEQKEKQLSEAWETPEISVIRVNEDTENLSGSGADNFFFS